MSEGSSGQDMHSFPSKTSPSDYLLHSAGSMADPNASSAQREPLLSSTPTSDGGRYFMGTSAHRFSRESAAYPCFIAGPYALSNDPTVYPRPGTAEDDDYLHSLEEQDEKRLAPGALVDTRTFTNMGCLALVIIGIIALFAGYPVVVGISNWNRFHPSNNVNLRNVTRTSSVIPGYRGLIDPDTPQDKYTRLSYYDTSKTLELVFSDEFNMDGRTFYPGEDPFWEALDLRYWQTGNMEWYDPASITTKDGALEITFAFKQQHDLNYTGGMLTSWNKMCFTGGVLEAGITLPGSPVVPGFWPALWMMGNLGRVGYGASTQGMWPYSYDTCDLGTLPNQTLNGVPEIVEGAGDSWHNGAFSYQPGQRLSRCTCPGAGKEHPGPKHRDGTYVGRASPELDVLEAVATRTRGEVSLSAQYAPYNFNYTFPPDGNVILTDPAASLNSYKGGVYQQAVSAHTATNQSCYELTGGCFSVYALEYKPGYDDGYISWIQNDQLAWTLLGTALQADPRVMISARSVPFEPMYIVANLGMSTSFTWIDWDNIVFPAKMRIDYIRVYQDPDQINIGCDPPDFPTQQYIEDHIEAYTNPNLTVWEDLGLSFPRNSLLEQC